MKVSVTIEDFDSFVKLLKELKGIGMLKKVPNKFNLSEEVFPLDIPIDADKVLEIIKNPMVKAKYGKAIDDILTNQALKVLG